MSTPYETMVTGHTVTNVHKGEVIYAARPAHPMERLAYSTDPSQKREGK